MPLFEFLQNVNLQFRPSTRWRPIVFGLCLALTSAIGCESKPARNDELVESQIDTPDPLNVLVVGDPELGQRVARQWSARRDGKLTIVNQTLSDFEASGFLLPEGVDVVVYPPSMMGELVLHERLRVIPSEFLASDDYNKNGLLRHFRTSVCRYRNESWAVPLGSPNFAMLTNRKLFEEISPPQRWDQMDRTLLKVAAAIDADSKNGVLEPRVDMALSKGWAAQTFLARVAPSICYRGKLSTVLDRSTLNPLINQPPFVEALEQLTKIASRRSSELDPAALFELAITGRSAIALTWPALGFSADMETENSDDAKPGSVLEEDSAVSESSQDTVMITSLPGTERWFDQKAATWIMRSKEDDLRVDLVGFSGLVASVSSTSLNERSAWDFLQWMPSEAISKLTMVESPLVGPFRASHLGDMARWTGEAISENVAYEYADVISANHERSLTLMFPRITGHSRYVDALDSAVRSAVLGEKTPEEALNAAAKKWDEITNEIGRDRQTSNLRKETAL